MNNTINKKNIYKSDKGYIDIFLILSNIILNTAIISISLYIRTMQFKEWILPFTILTLIQLIFNIITIVKLEKSLFSLTTFFLIFSYITHLGILIIFGFDIKVILPWNPLHSLSEDVFKEACYFAFYSHFFLTFGMCLVLRKRKKDIFLIHKSNGIKDENSELYLTRSIGMVLIILGILPMLYIDINRILLYIKGNYLSTYLIGVNGFIVTISRMTEIGAMMLLIGNLKNKKKAKNILLIILFYQGIIMLTGNRGRPIMYLMTIFFIYYNFIKKVKFKELIKMLVLIYIVGFLLTFIGQVRMMSIDNIENFTGLLRKSFIEFSLFKIFAEFGVTIITLGYSLVFFPDTRNFQIGTNYLVSLLTIFPNIGGILKPVIDKIIYVFNWPLSIRQYLGGSYLGELYYSFGKFGFIFAIFVGMMVAFISNQINKSFSKKQYVILSTYLILFPNLLWWIRNYFGDMVREFVWIAVVILILYKKLDNKISDSDKDEVKNIGVQ